MRDYPFVQARHFKRGRIKPIQLIVIHSAETQELAQSAENVAHYFATTDVVASAHFTVDNNSVVQSVLVEDTAFHCRNANASGIGIEHAGRASQTAEQWLDDYGKAMLELSAKLAAELCREYNIPASMAKFAGPNNPTVMKAGFCGHFDVPNHGSHHDPYRIGEDGKIDTSSFPWGWYLERVVTYLAE